MLFLLVLLFFVPPMISVFLYEKFRGRSLSDRCRIAMLLVYSFFINIVFYAVLWLRGWTYHNWGLDSLSTLNSVPFVLKYMALSLVLAVLFPYVVCLFMSKPVSDPDDNQEGK